MITKYMHVYLWSCPLHTANAIIVKTAELEDGEEFEPCTCITAFYQPLADISLDRRRLLRTYCPKCGEVE